MIKGDFSFINEPIQRELLTHDYKVIESVPDAWDALRNHDHTKSFMWDTEGEIWTKIRSVMWNGHSAASQSMCLRDLEFIAKYGWEKYVQR
jgi:hypothetical protein